MILAALTRFDNGFIYTVYGHSGYAEYGNDVICAAVSMLTHTIAESLKERSDIKSNIAVGYGSAHIEAMGKVDEIYKVLRCGLGFLKSLDQSEMWLKISVNDKLSKV